MKVLWVIPKSIHTEPITSTLPGEIYNYLSYPNVDIAHAGIIATTHEVKPDLILFLGVAEGPHFVPAKIFRQLKVPIIHICCDAGCPGWRRGIEYYLKENVFSFTVNIDGNDQWTKGPRDLTLWCPLDPSFYQPTIKTIKLSFAGGLGPERQKLVNELKDVITVMPRNETYGSYSEYADFLSQSQVTLNMAKSGSGLTLQTKNRVREAGYAKCLLLEERGAPTSHWFELGQDYLDYGSADEIRAILNSLTDLEVTVMGERLHKKTHSLYSPTVFWEKVLSQL